MAQKKKISRTVPEFGVRTECAVPVSDDHHRWLLDQALALRARRAAALDWDHLAEELEAMAARDLRELKNHLKNLLLHLLKFYTQPAELARHHSWRSSVWAAREAIADILEDSPGIFGGKREAVVAQCYARALREAVAQTGLPQSRFPEACPWSFDQIMADDFSPAYRATRGKLRDAAHQTSLCRQPRVKGAVGSG